MKGGQILNFLYKQAQTCGVQLEQPMQRLFMKSSIPFFHLLNNWLNAGEIDDFHSDFFIKENVSLTFDDFQNDYNEKYPFFSVYLLNFPLIGSRSLS